MILETAKTSHYNAVQELQPEESLSKAAQYYNADLDDYIDYYNNKRIKLKLKMSPVQYRTHFCRQIN